MDEIQSIDDTSELPDLDFTLIIDFKKGEGSPTRVFSAAKDLIDAFQAIDKVLVESIDANIKPIMMLENIERGSIKIKLRSALESIDDEALKDLNWKKIVGTFLVLSKHKILDWMDDEGPKRLPDLREKLQKLAHETDVRRLPDYSRPDPNGLSDGIKKIHKAKNRLSPEDHAYLEGGGRKRRIDISSPFEPEELENLAIKRIDKIPSSQMILTVKKPDYLGASKWDFLIRKQAISAKVEDSVFLSKFQSRELNVRPGDALRCMVIVEMKYDFNDELVYRTYTISKVLEVLNSI